MPNAHQTNRGFTSALGRGPTVFYDTALRVFTREWRWRGAVVDAVVEADPRTVLDVGCGTGTGTLAIAIAGGLPGAVVKGLDPDLDALAIAERKAKHLRHPIAWQSGFASDAALDGRAGTQDLVTCTLVLHQVPLAEKVTVLRPCSRRSGPGGDWCSRTIPNSARR